MATDPSVVDPKVEMLPWLCEEEDTTLELAFPILVGQFQYAAGQFGKIVYHHDYIRKILQYFYPDKQMDILCSISTTA